ncbi:MAG: hypothetical protein C0508_21160 [Cyanobacteria bacterium PR.023]|nr:hypothetical protein [Cyanobacteria bacterium PR.023]MDQ5935900.1 hypothetical protein [Cyanobacteriota bacterium erpe_2018_sw_21hr_WHONDRS-SW48-000092_B_bin.40]
MNIFLYSSLGTGLLTPMLILVVLAALLIAVLVVHEKADSFSGSNLHFGQSIFGSNSNLDSNQLISQRISQRINANPGQWGSYEKRLTEQPMQESACGGCCTIMWKPNKSDIA